MLDVYFEGEFIVVQSRLFDRRFEFTDFHLDFELALYEFSQFHLHCSA